jgi:L-ribulokinase
VLLNQVYANVLNKPVLVPVGDVTGLGAAAFAFLTAGIFTALEDAQKALCPPYKVYEPRDEAQPVYGELFDCYKRLYFAFGKKEPYLCDLTAVLPTLRRRAATT